MKLIDLLVKELPKRGGWPDGALSITQDNGGSLCVWDTNDPHYDGLSWKHHTGNSLMYFWCGEWTMPLSYDHKVAIVTYWQYKAALAESQKPAWNGEGLPPVGCECEYLDNNGKWYPVTIKYASDQLVVISGVTKILGVEQGTEIAKDIIIDKPQFRQLRTEAERKREVAAQALCDSLGGIGKVDEKLGFGTMWFNVYDAIAAGKIPGVKLED
ncbi:TPA: hypothetical protein ACP4T3_004181 [Escherichia coli]